MESNILSLPSIYSNKERADNSEDNFKILENSLKRLKGTSLFKTKDDSKLTSVFRVGSKETLADKLDKTNKIAEEDIQHLNHPSSLDKFDFLGMLTNPFVIALAGFAAVWAGKWVIKQMFGDTELPDLFKIGGVTTTGYEGVGAGGTSFIDFSEVVSRYESTGGYNDSYNKWSGNKDLSTMSAQDVYNMQRDALVNNDRTIITSGTNKGKRSSAIGLYQITSETLAGILKRGIIKPTDKFDRVTQQKIGWQLLIDAGFLRYVKDQNYEDIFIKRLINMWEGLGHMSKDQLIITIRRIKNKYIQEKFPSTTDVSGINIADVLEFTARTGDRAHFDRLKPFFRAKIIQLASSYKQKTGKKLRINSAFRSAQEQRKVNSPARVGKHMVGEAVDTPADTANVLSGLLGALGIQGSIHTIPTIHFHIQTSGKIEDLDEMATPQQEVKKKTPTPKTKKKPEKVSAVKANPKREKALVNNKNIQYNQNLIPNERGLELYSSNTPKPLSIPPSFSHKTLNIFNINDTINVHRDYRS
jgi:hypothetical protein